MELLHIIMPVAIGSLIGYCTNYIAIKMLFLPRKEHYIGKWRVPFTPGVIPKNKSRIASAVGDAVSNKLLTNEDIVERIKQSGIKENLVSKVMKLVTQEDNSIRTIIEGAAPTLDMEKATSNISDVVTDKILNGIQKIDMATIVSNMVQSNFADLLANPMLAMFGGGSIVNSICDKIASAITEYIDMHGYEVVYPMVKQEVDALLDDALLHHLQSLDIPEERFSGMIEDVIDRFIENQSSNLLNCLNVKAIVEEKINAMDVKELEELVLSIMKKELQSVINLGAVIGAVIGIINVFI